MKLDRAVDATMCGQLFTLVESDEDLSKPTPSEDVVYAWGVQITTSSEQFAIVFGGGGASHMVGVHESAEAACRHHGHMRPLALQWSSDRITMVTDESG